MISSRSSYSSLSVFFILRGVLRERVSLESPLESSSICSFIKIEGLLKSLMVRESLPIPVVDGRNK